jgi:TolB protein
MATNEKKSPDHPLGKNFRIGLLALVAIIIVVSGAILWPTFLGRIGKTDESGNSRLATEVAAMSASLQTTPSPTFVAATIPVSQPPSVVTPTSEDLVSPLNEPHQLLPGAAILSVLEGSYAHLYAFLPGEMRFIRLTAGDWQDLAPALSPDGKMLAFASNRGGHWDLYVLNLEDGKTIQLTDTPEYEGSPSWSPDNRWLAYEAYIPDETGGNLEIFVRTIDGSQDVVRLTDDPAADYDPAWSPSGRTIAFVSTRNGGKDIWLANLDQSSNMFSDISRDPALAETSPAWSPDGSKLCWTATDADGIETIRILDPKQPDNRAVAFEIGSLPAWGPTGAMLLAVYHTPNRSYLTGYRLVDGRPFIPPLDAGGEILGITWGLPGLASLGLPDISSAARFTPPPLWLPRLQSGSDQPGDRVSVVQLPGVQAPLAMLQDRADESFFALRERVAREIGWDFLAILDQAYVPLTTALDPGFLQDWLYTGRAFQFNSAPVSAGWVAVVREDFGPQTYWRIYLRARFQDGTQGLPIKAFPWDFASRHAGDPRAFEEGGVPAQTIPAGYWVDFTSLAAAFGWERLPSLSSWRVAYSSIRYNEYVLRQGLDWFSAMLEVYPRQALDTPTPVSSPTITPTFTSTSTNTPTVTQTRYIEPSITPSLTRRPSLTPTPSSTRRPTLTTTPSPLP